MKLKTALDIFLMSCYARGLLPRTIDNYKVFNIRFIEEIGNIETGNLSYKIVEKYISDLYRKSLSIATVGTYIRHMKVFIRYLEKERYIFEPFSKDIHPPRLPKKIVTIYTDEQIKEIFKTIDIIPDWIKYRNCLIIALMLDCGLRLNEVVCIDYKDIDFSQNFLKVHGKGNKERLVPLGKITNYYLNNYIGSLPKDYTLINRLLFTYKGDELTRNAVKLLMQKLSKKFNFPFSAHKLRHNFATNYCIDEYEKRGTVDIFKLMVLLGHEDIQTTRRYLHLANQIIVSKSNISHLDKIFY